MAFATARAANSQHASRPTHSQRQPQGDCAASGCQLRGPGAPPKACLPRAPNPGSPASPPRRTWIRRRLARVRALRQHRPVDRHYVGVPQARQDAGLAQQVRHGRDGGGARGGAVGDQQAGAEALDCHVCGAPLGQEDLGVHGFGGGGSGGR
jgi:hypothetical protein